MSEKCFIRNFRNDYDCPQDVGCSFCLCYDCDGTFCDDCKTEAQDNALKADYLEKQKEILHQALKAIATPQEYKLVMQEVEKVNQQTKGE